MRHIAQRDGHPARCRLERYLAKILQIAEIARGAYHIFGLTHLHNRPAGFLIGRLDRADNFPMRHPERSHAVGIEYDLILFHHPAHTGDLGYAGNGLEFIAQEPVLQTSQPRQIMAAGAIDQRIFVNPPYPGRIGTKRRGHAVRQIVLNLTEIFQHARARPVEIGPVFEDDVNKAVAEHRIAANRLHTGHRQHGCRERIGDLVLHNLRCLTSKVRADDNLHVGQIRQGIDRRGAHCPHAG